MVYEWMVYEWMVYEWMVYEWMVYEWMVYEWMVYEWMYTIRGLTFCVSESISVIVLIFNASVAAANTAGAAADCQNISPKFGITSRIRRVELYCTATSEGGPQFLGLIGSGQRQNCEPCAEESCVVLWTPGEQAA
jgi:hypothetical protein